MGFFEQIRKLNVEGYAKGGKADSGGKSSGGGKSSSGSKGTKSSGPDDGFRGGNSTKGDKTPGPVSSPSSPVSGPSVNKGGGGGGGGASSSPSTPSTGGFGGGGGGGSSNLAGGSGNDSLSTSATGKQQTARSPSVPTPTPRPDRVTVATEQGPRDVLFDEYAKISLDPTGINARSIGYIEPDPLPEVSPEIESAINDYMNREPTFMDKALDYLSYVSPLASIANTMSEFSQQAIQDQLTTPVNTYQGTGIGTTAVGQRVGQAISRPNENVDRYAPVTNQNGQIIGSMALDAGGNPVAYTGTQTPNATFNDPNMSDAQRQAASDMINPFSNMGGGGDDNTQSMGQMAGNAALQNFTQQEPECPEGYMYDTTSQSCVPRPDMAPFPEIQTFTPAPPPMPQYTASPSFQAPTLTPGIASGFNLTPTTMPPIGLASLNPFTS
jgi:hypothetical protein